MLRKTADFLDGMSKRAAIIMAKRFFRYRFPTVMFLLSKFKMRFGLSRPSLFVPWLATYDCNFYCDHCEANSGKQRADELTTQEVFSLIDQLSEMKVKRFFITGGEPLVRKDIFQVIRHLSDKKIRYGMASNSYLVNRYKPDFRRYKPYLYFTSLDGLEHTNDTVRKAKGAFNRVLDALEFFKDIGVRERWVNTVVHPGNLDQLPELKQILKNSAVTYWRLAFLIPVGRAKDNQKMSLSEGQIRHVLKFALQNRKDLNIGFSEDIGFLGCSEHKLRIAPFYCGAGLTRCTVMPDGEVLPCQIVYDMKFSEGNIREKPFEEIWKNGFQDFRNPRFDEECLTCSYFQACRGGCWGMRKITGTASCLYGTMSLSSDIEIGTPRLEKW